jgi:hypothetical protein
MVMRFVQSAVVVVTMAWASATSAEPLAFPGAEGFGALATGGRGGEVVRVTNLDDSGPGSLRDAVSQPNRIVVFDVAGVIAIESALVFSDNLTIAGQSAPGPVVVYGHGASFSHRQNIIVRYITFRQGFDSPRGTKSVNITDGHNMMFDHVSIGWGRWDNLGITNRSTDITFQHCLIAEPIDPQRFGALIDSSRRLSIIGNLWVSNHSRNPKGKADMQYINNVVYNWGSNGYGGGHSGAVWNQDLIGNIFIAGPNSRLDGALTGFTDTDHVYDEDNILDLERDGELGGRPAVQEDYVGWRDPAVRPTFKERVYNEPPVAVRVYSPQQAFHRAIAWAGNSLHRDHHDQRAIDHARSLGTEGRVIHNEDEVGGIGEIPTSSREEPADEDGIPRQWKIDRGLDSDDPKAGLTIDEETGYMWVEIYLNSLCPSEPDLAVVRSGE